MAIRTSSGNDDGLMAEINITPLVDVMLVLLVIFIITTPLMMSALKLDLPKAQSAPTGAAQRVVSIAINAQGDIYLDKELIDLDAWANALRTRANQATQDGVEELPEVQLQADVMGIDITRPLIGETTALGAAYAAGLAVGFWSSTDELRKQWQQSRRWSSTSTAEQRSVGYAGWKKAVERTLNWVD